MMEINLQSKINLSPSSTIEANVDNKFLAIKRPLTENETKSRTNGTKVFRKKQVVLKLGLVSRPIEAG